MENLVQTEAEACLIFQADIDCEVLFLYSQNLIECKFATLLIL